MIILVEKGIFEIVCDCEAIFLTELEPSIEILDRAEVKLVEDNSPAYSASLQR